MTKEEQELFDAMTNAWDKQQELCEQGKAHTPEHQESIKEYLKTINFDKE